MKLLVYVMNKVDLMDRFIHRLKEINIKGATVIESTGMGRILAENDDMDFIGSLKVLFDNPRAISRTFLMALEDEQVPVVLHLIDEIAGDLSRPNTGIVFTLPIETIKGYKK
jgi:nitrogen regulatory protein PII